MISDNNESAKLIDLYGFTTGIIRRTAKAIF